MLYSRWRHGVAAPPLADQRPPRSRLPFPAATDFLESQAQTEPRGWRQLCTPPPPAAAPVSAPRRRLQESRGAQTSACVSSLLDRLLPPPLLAAGFGTAWRALRRAPQWPRGRPRLWRTPRESARARCLSSPHERKSPHTPLSRPKAKAATNPEEVPEETLAETSGGSCRCRRHPSRTPPQPSLLPRPVGGPSSAGSKPLRPPTATSLRGRPSAEASPAACARPAGAPRAAPQARPRRCQRRRQRRCCRHCCGCCRHRSRPSRGDCECCLCRPHARCFGRGGETPRGAALLEDWPAPLAAEGVRRGAGFQARS
mmetsp:Transcript_53748/g.107977  ORF Transcript_53748/g.107977 Transcript_53748/m.107977 type:complete len:313 (-) Transcript_53748:167-1105(-)